MVSSAAQTATAYLASLPEDRRADISTVRDMVLKSLPAGVEEMMSFGMIGYGIPLSRFPNTYNKQPLCFVYIAAQKNFNALYLMCSYMNPDVRTRLADGFRVAGKKFDMGKSCVRYQKASDLPMAVISELISSISPKRWLEIYAASRQLTAAGKKASAKSGNATEKSAAAKKTLKAAGIVVPKRPTKKAMTKKVVAKNVGETSAARKSAAKKRAT